MIKAIQSYNEKHPQAPIRWRALSAQDRPNALLSQEVLLSWQDYSDWQRWFALLSRELPGGQESSTLGLDLFVGFNDALAAKQEMAAYLQNLGRSIAISA